MSARESGRIILVGLAPPAKGEPEPLYPSPGSSWGARVVAMTGLTPGQYLDTFERRYCLAEPVGYRQPGMIGLRDGADRIIDDLKPGARLVLLGKLVARAFGLEDRSGRGDRVAWHAWVAVGYAPRCRIAAVPMPSHSANWYSEPRHHAEAVRFWRAVAAECARGRKAA